jgi:hypothetical protein
LDEEIETKEEEFVAKFLEEKSEEPSQSSLPSLETVFENDWPFAAFVAAVILVANAFIGMTFPIEMVAILVLTEAFLFCTIFIWMFLKIRTI